MSNPHRKWSFPSSVLLLSQDGGKAITTNFVDSELFRRLPP
jgi:hypothetical protein